MDTDLSFSLRILKEKLAKGLSDSDLSGIEDVLQDYSRDAFEKLSHDQTLENIVLSIEILLSVLTLDINASRIRIRLKCLYILKEYLNERLICEEFKKIRKELKKELFYFGSQSRNFHSNYSAIFEQIRTEVYDTIFDSNYLLKLEQIDIIFYSLRRILNKNEESMNNLAKDKIISGYRVSEHLKRSYAKRMSQTFLTIIELSNLNVELKSELQLFNNYCLESRINRSNVEILCERLDKTIKTLIKNPDNFEILQRINFLGKNQQSIAAMQINQVFETSQLDSRQFNIRYLETKISKDSSNPQYIEFELMYVYTLNIILNYFTNSNSLNDLIKFMEFRINGFNFSKAFRFLRQLPVNISQTICEIMGGVSTTAYHDSFFQYFLKSMYTVEFYKINEDDSNMFISLALKNPIKEILEKFKSSNYALEDELRRVTSNIHFVTFPNHLTGITLKTLQISLKLYNKKKYSNVHLSGGYFLIYLHELAHYLQRTRFEYVRETNKSLSPDLDSTKPEEGGIFLEKLIFGSEQFIISEKQSRFLVNGVYPNSIEDFKNDYSQAGVGDSKTLMLTKYKKVLLLGKCASVYGVTPIAFTDLVNK